MGIYKAAGVKYFFALANHHDDFDSYASTNYSWNSTRVGPKKASVNSCGIIALTGKRWIPSLKFALLLATDARGQKRSDGVYLTWRMTTVSSSKCSAPA